MCKSKKVQPQREAPVSLLQMQPKAILPSENLSSWYFAVRWARMTMEHESAKQKELGWDTSYTDDNVGKLLQLETFLNVSWDAYMEWLQTPIEVSSDV
jgi:hypothetical protein